MKLYKRTYKGVQCKFLGKTFKVQKLEGEKVYIELEFLKKDDYILQHQLEEFTDEEIERFEIDDDNTSSF